jgi:hypothetical protein
LRSPWLPSPVVSGPARRPHSAAAASGASHPSSARLALSHSLSVGVAVGQKVAPSDSC